MSRRKLIIIASILIVVIIIGWVIFLTQRKTPPQESPVSFPSPTLSISFAPIPSPSAQPKQFELLSSHFVLGPMVTQNAISFFDTADKFLKTITLLFNTKQETHMSEKTFDAIQNLWWSPDKKYALFQFEEYGLQRFSVFDVQQGLLYQLPEDVRAATWSPDGKRIAIYRGNTNLNQFYLATVSQNGGREQKLSSIRLSDPVIVWPTANSIYLYQKPTPEMALENIFTYTFATKQLASVTIIEQEGTSTLYGTEILPAPENATILISQTDSKGHNIRLMLFDNKTKSLRTLPFQTIVQKCAWANSETVYCAYSKELQNTSSAIPFDYWKGKVSTSDSFGRFNVKTGELKVYAENTGYDAIDLAVSTDESFLVFVNRKDLSLYKMKL